MRSYFQNSCFVFHRGIQTPRNNKSTRPTASCFHLFLGVWIPRWNTRSRFGNSTWITHWALALVMGNKEPHEAKKKYFDLGGNRTHDLRIRSTVTLPTELQGRTEKVGDDFRWWIAAKIACVAGGIARASAFVLVAKLWTGVAKAWEGWCRVELNSRLPKFVGFFWIMRSPVHANFGLAESPNTSIKC